MGVPDPDFANASQYRRSVTTRIDNTWERESLNTAPTANTRVTYRRDTAYFEALDIVAAAVATFMLVALLTVSAYGS